MGFFTMRSHIVKGYSGLANLRKNKSHFVPRNVSASKQAIIHIQVYDMGWATEENVTITAYVETIAHIAPIVLYIHVCLVLSELYQMIVFQISTKILIKF